LFTGADQRFFEQSASDPGLSQADFRERRNISHMGGCAGVGAHVLKPDHTVGFRDHKGAGVTVDFDL